MLLRTMLSLIKRVFIFLAFFLTFGVVGVLLDLLTKGKYGIRQNLVAARGIATLRVARVFAGLKRGWLWSPVLFLGFVLSPVAFVFFLGVAIYDMYRVDEVYYSESGERVVYRGKPVTADDIDRNPMRDDWFKTRLASIFGGGSTGILYRGGPLPSGWIPESKVSREDREKALKLNWRLMELGGNRWYAPPLSEPQDLVLSEIEVSTDD